MFSKFLKQNPSKYFVCVVVGDSGVMSSIGQTH